MTIKGYSSQKKILDQQHVTLQPINAERDAVDVVSHSAVTLVGADAVEALSTKRVIVATAHAAKRGYVILMTSGAASGEYCSVGAVEANAIYLGQELSVIPSAADTFEIYRYVLNSVSATGAAPVIVAPSSISQIIRHDYTVTGITQSAYTQLIASTTAVINQMLLFDSSGETMVLAVGPAAGEVDKLYIFSGGFSGPVDFLIPIGSRISAKAVSNDATVGELTINFLG